jgi:hypothetical protein
MEQVGYLLLKVMILDTELVSQLLLSQQLILQLGISLGLLLAVLMLLIGVTCWI